MFGFYSEYLNWKKKSFLFWGLVLNISVLTGFFSGIWLPSTTSFANSYCKLSRSILILWPQNKQKWNSIQTLMSRSTHIKPAVRKLLWLSRPRYTQRLPAVETLYKMSRSTQNHHQWKQQATRWVELLKHCHQKKETTEMSRSTQMLSPMENDRMSRPTQTLPPTSNTCVDLLSCCQPWKYWPNV